MTDRQRGRQTERQADRKTDIQRGRQTDRQTYREAGRQSDRQTERQTDSRVNSFGLIIRDLIEFVQSLSLLGATLNNRLVGFSVVSPSFSPSPPSLPPSSIRPSLRSGQKPSAAAAASSPDEEKTQMRLVQFAPGLLGAQQRRREDADVAGPISDAVSSSLSLPLYLCLCVCSFGPLQMKLYLFLYLSVSALLSSIYV